MAGLAQIAVPGLPHRNADRNGRRRRRYAPCEWLRIKDDPLSGFNVRVPAADPTAVIETANSAGQAERVKSMKSEPGAIVLKVGSGAYRFESILPKTTIPKGE